MHPFSPFLLLFAQTMSYSPCSPGNIDFFTCWRQFYRKTSFDIFISYFHFIFSFHRKTHLRCISSILLHYNCKINANIQDVYRRTNLERARKGRLQLVFMLSQFSHQVLAVKTYYYRTYLCWHEYMFHNDIFTLWMWLFLFHGKWNGKMEIIMIFYYFRMELKQS